MGYGFVVDKGIARPRLMDAADDFIDHDSLLCHHVAGESKARP